MHSSIQPVGRISCRFVVTALATVYLAGCAFIPQFSSSDSDAVASTVVAAPAVVEPEEIEYGSFSEDQLYQAIISELGARRGRLRDAGDGYFDLALETRDLGIIQRAVQIASVNGDTNALLQLGMLWAEVEPTNAQPHLMLSFQFLESGVLAQALSHMVRVIELGGDMDFSALATRTGRLSPEDRLALIARIRELSREHEQQPSMRMALAQLLAQNQQFEDALLELQLLIQLTESTPNIILLQAQILRSMEAGAQALRLLRAGVRQFEQDQQLRLSYAQLLIENDEFEDARAQFQALIEQDPQDWGIHYRIAMLDLEMENFPDATAGFTRLIEIDQRVDDQLVNDSQFWLGYIYEQQQDLARAVEHYRQVKIGSNNFLAAQQQATRFAIELGDLEDAHTWLSRLSRGQPRLEILLTTIESSILIQAGHAQNAKSRLDSALDDYPNEADLLFARVLYYDSESDQEGSERDLRQIISMQPDDSRALNHLGYMLADQTTRFEEALDLIERAISIAPDEPAIIDSLAWAQYKLGRYEDALKNIRRAFAAFPDPEVASHLGEVLWMMGRRQEASRVWLDALEESPDSELIKAVLERFQPES